VLRVLGKVLIILGLFDEVQAYCLRAQAHWSGDSRLERNLLYLQRKMTTEQQAPAHKVGFIKYLKFPEPPKPPFAFITPDDGSPDIYFLQEEIDSELQELLHVGMRVWADTHIVKGQTRAIQVGMEEVSQAF